MDSIKYSYNWNHKLFCDCWSTIRLKNDDKYKEYNTYHHHLINPKGIITFSRQATLIFKHNFLLKDMTEAMALLDTGYRREEAIKMITIMYKNKNINFETQKFTFMVFSSKI